MISQLISAPFRACATVHMEVQPEISPTFTNDRLSETDARDLPISFPNGTPKLKSAFALLCKFARSDTA
ncbi:hypothetical protein QWZ16_08635 [Vibrio ostreicida]|uniref:Uncharacterized protein n=1 Tax=Vibrio ostreicida TaxID=526588 RepID=A0ABT8BRQ7_9VIBR|nr:hypothetical protein [Vibrio ostreicida]MDN3609765.1 hypothetical protein [Vibrio ostreicida]